MASGLGGGEQGAGGVTSRCLGLELRVMCENILGICSLLKLDFFSIFCFFSPSFLNSLSKINTVDSA